MDMKKLIFSAAFAVMLVSGCNTDRTAGVPEYIMFSDTLSVNPVLKDTRSFTVPVVSSVVCDYDRTVGVEIVDKGSTAVEGLNYRLGSNTVVIPAGETRADVEVFTEYDTFNDTDSLQFSMRLVIPDAVRSSIYGDETKVRMFKVCPFDVSTFSGWCVVTSLFLYNYPGIENTSIQRLIWSYPGEEPGTVVLQNWLFTGYDITVRFDSSDPSVPVIDIPEDQMLSDELSVFGQINADNRILISSSPAMASTFNSCSRSADIWFYAYLKDFSETVGPVGHFENSVEWVSNAEAERLVREEGMIKRGGPEE